MGRSAVFEGVQQVAELGVAFLFGQAQDAEDGVLDVAVMDSDRAAAQLHAVQHAVVSLGLDFFRVAFQQGHVFVLAHGEGMVHGLEAVVLVAPFEHGEVHHPQEVQLVLVDQAHALGAFAAQMAQSVGGDLGVGGHEHQHVAGLSVHTTKDLVHLFLSEELGDGGDQLAVFLDHDVGQTAGAVDGHVVLQAVHGAAGEAGVFGVDAAHPAALLRHGGEGGEFAFLTDVGDIDQLHAEAQVRLVGTEAAHGLVPGHHREGDGDVPAQSFLEHVLQHAFAQLADVLFLHEAQLHVQLGEFRLAVGAQVLVPEAAGDLEIAVHAGHHEDLLEQLRALGQSEEFARLHAGGHQIVAGAFGRALAQHGSFDLVEAVLVHKAAGGDGDLVAQAQGVHHLRPAQVQIAVFQADHLVHVHVVLDEEGRGLGLVEADHFIAQHFDLARGLVGVEGFLVAHAHLAVDVQHVLAAGGFGGGKGLLVAGFGIEDHLDDALTVPQVDEDEAAVVAVALDPAAEGDFPAGVGGAQAAAVIGTFHHSF